jgi:hypothetical protein
LDEQLAASRHETEEARLQEVLLMEDCERTVVAGIYQGVNIALVALQLHISQDFCQVAPEFPDHARQAERAELVSGFAIIALPSWPP